MKRIDYKAGMIVEHPNRPQWGPGKIVAVKDDRVHVLFRDALEPTAKTIVTSVVQLKLQKRQSDEVLDRLEPAVRHGDRWVLPDNRNGVHSPVASQAAANQRRAVVKPGGAAKRRRPAPHYRSN